MRSMGQFESRVLASPALENSACRSSATTRPTGTQYDDLLSKANSAEMSAGVEQRQIGEQFRILDAARVPERPFSPNRPQIVGLGLSGGLALGIGIIVLLEFRDASFHTVDDVVSTWRCQSSRPSP